MITDVTNEGKKIIINGEKTYKMYMQIEPIAIAAHF